MIASIKSNVNAIPITIIPREKGAWIEGGEKHYPYFSEIMGLVLPDDLYHSYYADRGEKSRSRDFRDVWNSINNN